VQRQAPITKLAVIYGETLVSPDLAALIATIIKYTVR
jgi:hypothetical protein